MASIYGKNPEEIIIRSSHQKELSDILTELIYFRETITIKLKGGEIIHIYYKLPAGYKFIIKKDTEYLLFYSEEKLFEVEIFNTNMFDNDYELYKGNKIYIPVGDILDVY